MHIVMHCGGLPFNGDTLKTKSLGGSETAAYYMARELVRTGHNVTIFTNEQATGTFDGVKYEWSGAASQDQPLGERFAFYAENTPHDVCIIQRHPQAFARRLASKINLWWLHDIALRRNKDAVGGMMWNVDKVLVVSEHHRKQVSKVYGIPTEHIAVVNNAIDPALFADLKQSDTEDGRINLIYSSRPERGLLHLVRAGGIMDRLRDTNIHLHVCGYENTTPAMREFYEMLWERCEQLPNVTRHGALDKQTLACLMGRMDALAYPTEFEEVSCITAMEAMAAGIGIISSDHGALPETCAGSAAILLPLKDGQADEDLFVSVLRDHADSIKARSAAINRQTAQKYSWYNSAQQVLDAVHEVFTTANWQSVAHHFLRHSDIEALEQMGVLPCTPYSETIVRELDTAYWFKKHDAYAQHYLEYYQYEKDRGVNYGPEDVTRTTRFQTVANYVGDLGDGARVLDYGCAHGHYTVALARRYPTITFVGADITQSNIDTARKWAADEGLTNVQFVKVDGVVANSTFEDSLVVNGRFAEFDLIIAAEVIEHVGNPQEYTDALAAMLKSDGHMVITTPYGPWEAQGYREHGYWRAHLHHFERQDIVDAWGHHPDFRIQAAPSGISKFHSVLGSYIFSFGKPNQPSCAINYARKQSETMPDATFSCCMIAKDAEADIIRCLQSVVPHVQEVIIGVDQTTTDRTRELLYDFASANPLVAFDIFSIASPLETGFDEARNATIQRASCDWVLWIDSDEVLVGGEWMGHYARHSMYNGFAIRQHHFSHDPVAVVKVDLPCRLFRNRMGIKFFGKVHEHPEVKLNEGVGPVMLMPNTNIVHHGYHDESVRRGRFSRNLPLLKRDREENPDRVLGKFLWIRDLAQACQYDMEDGSAVEAVIMQRAREGIALWEELLDSKNYRIIIDSLPFYSHLCQLLGGGFDFAFRLDASAGEATTRETREVRGYFHTKEHALRLMNELAEERIAPLYEEYQ